jgi:glycopeptide antibiotics resistance protein
MSARHERKSASHSTASLIHSTRLHVVLYSMLLVATPFIMLKAFLQDAIGQASTLSVDLGGLNLPIVPVVAIAFLVSLLLLLRRHLSWPRVLAGAVAILMIAVAQQITDYYADHNFYDLQQNWHYLAYCLFALVMYLDLKPRGLPAARIMLITYLAAVILSTGDEIFQRHMSHRVFDISDIAKDAWGVLIGIVFLHLGRERTEPLRDEWRGIRQRSPGDYLRHPPSLLVLLLIASLSLLCISSLLTEAAYWRTCILLSIAGAAIAFLLLHVSQYRRVGTTLLLVACAAALAQTVSWHQHRADGIVHNRYGLTVYRGIPIPFFDVMFFPDGTFRLVDKKHYFNQRDQRFLLSKRTDIIIIGSGAEGRGGRGFVDSSVNQFLFNEFTDDGTQVIILRSPDACRLFNKLRRERKNVLFVLHNTC